MSIVTRPRFTVPGVTSGVAVPPPSDPLLTTIALTSSPDGGNNQLTVPSAVHHGSTTFYGWVDGNGHLEGAERDTGGTTRGPFTIHSNLEDDAHSSPAFIRRASDGKWLAVYSRHNAAGVNLRLSTNADSFNGWSAATNVIAQLGGTRYTNSQVFERSDTLWLVVRDEPSAGTDSRWVISSCASASYTSGWATQTIVFRQASTRTYITSWYDSGEDRLHFIATNGANTGFTKLGHFYRDMAAGTYHKSDGTGITLPLDFSEITEIHSGAGGAFPWNVTVDGDGHPVLCARENLDTLYVRYDGSSWSSTTVCSTDTGYEYSGAGSGFIAWGACVDDGDPDQIFVLRDIGGGSAQLYRYQTGDGGATFSESQITTTLSAEETQLICVRNPDELRAYWQSGSWTTYTNYSQLLRGVLTT